MVKVVVRALMLAKARSVECPLWVIREIGAGLINVRFTPKSGHPAFTLHLGPALKIQAGFRDP